MGGRQYLNHIRASFSEALLKISFRCHPLPLPVTTPTSYAELQNGHTVICPRQFPTRRRPVSVPPFVAFLLFPFVEFFGRSVKASVCDVDGGGWLFRVSFRIIAGLLGFGLWIGSVRCLLFFCRACVSPSVLRLIIARVLMKTS